MNETPRKPERTGDDPDGPLNVKRYVWWMLLIAVAVLVLTQLLASPMITGEVPISYSELKEKIRAGAVEKVTLVDEFVVATPTEEALQASRDEGPDIELKSWRTTRVRDDESLVPLLEDYDIAYEAQYTSSCDASFVWFWLVGMFAVFMLWSMMMRRAGGMGGLGGPNAVMSFGRSKAKLNIEEGTGVTFADVAGCDEAKEELEEVVERDFPDPDGRPGHREDNVLRVRRA